MFDRSRLHILWHYPANNTHCLRSDFQFRSIVSTRRIHSFNHDLDMLMRYFILHPVFYSSSVFYSFTSCVSRILFMIVLIFIAQVGRLPRREINLIQFNRMNLISLFPSLSASLPISPPMRDGKSERAKRSEGNGSCVHLSRVPLVCLSARCAYATRGVQHLSSPEIDFDPEECWVRAVPDHFERVASFGEKYKWRYHRVDNWIAAR